MVTAAEPRAQTGWLIEDQRHIVLFDISWDAYEALLADHTDRTVPHFYFDGGVLEIVGPGFEHEQAKVALQQIVEILSEAWLIDNKHVGSTTHKRRDLQKGFEADTAFYLANAERMRGKKELDLTVDPPADLVIEIDIANSSLARLPIYAAIGVPEVWRYVRGRVEIRRLVEERYLDARESGFFSGLTGESLAMLVAEEQPRTWLEWRRFVRQWAMQQHTS